MKFLSLNIRGMGSVDKIDWLKDIAKKKDRALLVYKKRNVPRALKDLWIERLWGSEKVGFP